MGLSRAVAIQLPLGFSSGLPLYLSGSTLTAWLSDAAVSIEEIGAFALVSLPYNLKFLWAPLLDRFVPPFLGRRRGWMAIFQLVVIALVAAMSFVAPRNGVSWLAVLSLCTAFFSASQDVVIDAYRTDVLADGERGRGTTTYVAGYRLGLIISGSLSLVLADLIGWNATYLVMAAILALGPLATLWAHPAPTSETPDTVRESIVAPLRELWQRPAAIWLLLFVATYRLGDALAQHMIVPFLRHIEFSQTEVGLVQNGFGMAATIVGAWIGGSLVDRIGLRRSLLYFGIVQAGANLGYIFLAWSEPSLLGLAVAVSIDNICNGLGVAAFVAFLMCSCDLRYSATQYALFSSLSTILGRTLSAGAGFFIAATSFALFFGASIALAVPALLLLPRLVTRSSPEHGEL